MASADTVRSAQQALKDHGFDPGEIDGKMGPRTEAALKQFQGSKGMQASGQLDSKTLAALGVSGGGTTTASAGSTGGGSTTAQNTQSGSSGQGQSASRSSQGGTSGATSGSSSSRSSDTGKSSSATQ
jgi:peptidoglycan hydrolase-like protein with peptidoglycan-binding domain